MGASVAGAGAASPSPLLQDDDGEAFLETVEPWMSVGALSACRVLAAVSDALALIVSPGAERFDHRRGGGGVGSGAGGTGGGWGVGSEGGDVRVVVARAEEGARDGLTLWAGAAGGAAVAVLGMEAGEDICLIVSDVLLCVCVCACACVCACVCARARARARTCLSSLFELDRDGHTG